MGQDALDMNMTEDTAIDDIKESCKAVLVREANRQLDKHCAAMNDMLLIITMPPFDADFTGAIAGLTSLQSIKDALDTTLTNAKIEATDMAMKIKAMIDAVEAMDARHLFPDIRMLTRHPIEIASFVAIIQQRKQAESSIK